MRFDHKLHFFITLFFITVYPLSPIPIPISTLLYHSLHRMTEYNKDFPKTNSQNYFLTTHNHLTLIPLTVLHDWRVNILLTHLLNQNTNVSLTNYTHIDFEKFIMHVMFGIYEFFWIFWCPCIINDNIFV